MRTKRLAAQVGLYNRNARESMATREELVAELAGKDGTSRSSRRFRVEGGAAGNSALTTSAAAHRLARRVGGVVVEVGPSRTTVRKAEARAARAERIAAGCARCGGKVHISPISHRPPKYCSAACEKRAELDRRKAKRVAARASLADLERVGPSMAVVAGAPEDLL